MAVELDGTFFQKVFRDHERDDSIEIFDMEQQPTCEKGENFLAVVTNVTVRGVKKVEGTTREYVKSVVVKQMPCKDEEHIEHFAIDVAFANEVEAYNKIIPTLNKFIPDPLSIPECLYADKTTIVLQDLKQLGYENLKEPSFGVEDTKNIVRELAKLHAASLVMRAKEPENFQHLTQRVTEMLYTTDKTTKLLETQAAQLSSSIELLNSLPSCDQDENLQTGLQALKELDGKTNKLMTDLIVNQTTGLEVINHGDLWRNNILINRNDQKVQLVDLQMMRLSSIAADLSYFLYVNLEPALLTANMKAFLVCYFDALVSNVRSQTTSLESSLTMRWLEEEMHKFAVFGTVSALWVIPVFYRKDLELSFETPEEEVVVSEEEKSRIVEVVLHYAQHCRK